MKASRALLLGTALSGLLLAGCSPPNAPSAPGTEACLASVRDRAGLPDWTARSDAVLVGHVEKAEGSSKRVVRVEQQWAGRPVENPFTLEIADGEPDAKVGSSWVLFLQRGGGGNYTRLLETRSLSLEVTAPSKLDGGEAVVLGKGLPELKAEVLASLQLGPKFEAELRRLANGAPSANPVRLEYREVKGERFDRWIYVDGSMVRCGTKGPVERKMLTPEEARRFAHDLSETRFWTSSSGAPLPRSTPARDLDLAVEVAGVVLTFHEQASAEAAVVPVIRAVETRLGPSSQNGPPKGR